MQSFQLQIVEISRGSQWKPAQVSELSMFKQNVYGNEFFSIYEGGGGRISNVFPEA